jgi:2-polyprenyl-3-methyl-5-hydroxy-6-metoxy-1,4-benzoquinol methylase
MFSGMKSVLEIGCGDGFASRIVAQEVGTLTATDFDSLMIGFARDLDIPKSGIVWDTHDFLDEPPASFVGEFDGVFMLDVLEHIKPESEAQFISNVMKCLRPEGCVIFGIPSLESQIYASPQSKLGHVNCKSGNDFRNTLKLSFSNVFLFSMNDEVVHTGFLPMAHYLLALCTNKRS